MSTPKKIEDLTELTNLDGNELLMIAVPQTGSLASHMTMKISLNTLANYVNSLEGGSGTATTNS